MARPKASIQPITTEIPAEVTSEVTLDAVAEVTPALEEAPVVTINLDPTPEPEPPLSNQTLAEMEAGRASIARFQEQ